MNDIHDFFQTPPDDAVIWRYRKFPHFKSEVVGKTLHFTSAFNLDDRREGKIPRTAMEKWRRHGDIGARFLKQYERSLHCFHVNCWTVRQDENSKMWEHYAIDKPGNYDRGVVVKSTFKRLRESFVHLSDDLRSLAHQRVYFGLVRYIDYDGPTDLDDVYDYYRGFEKISNVEGCRWFEIALDDIESELMTDPFPTLPPILFVDKSCDWEKELRVLTVPYSTEVLAEDDEEGSCDIEVDLSRLIECIHVAPTAHSDFIAEVRETLKENDLDVPVEPSALAVDI